MTRECQEDEHDWTGRRNQQDDKVESGLLGHAYLDWMHMDLDIDTTDAGISSLYILYGQFHRPG